MAVYYKFKSAKDYDSISLDGHFITVASLKEKIYESKQLGRGTDYDLVVTNAQTNEEYIDEDMLIPKNTSVLIRRIPGQPRKPIVAAPVTEQDEPKMVNVLDNAQQAKSNFSGVGFSAPNYLLDGSEYDEFGNDLYEIPEVVPVVSSNQFQDAPAPSKADEDSKIQALIDTPALDWQQQNFDGFGGGRGFGRGMGGRMGSRGFGRNGGGGFERKTPPPGYICHRCKTPGHFIQHCPTNGDPNFDIKRVKPPTGIPKSMLMATPDGSYALPSGTVAVLKPNESAFEREIEGMPSTRTIGDLPPELHCPLCKEVMKDAVLTSKCCFKSFCDKCIRDQLINKSICVCGATNVLADDLLPNKTLRDTINRILESNISSAENGGSAYHIQDMESARCLPPQPKIPSPSQSAASKGEQKVPTQNGDTTKMQTGPTENDVTPLIQPAVSGKGIVTKAPDVSEATYDSRSMMEPASQGSARPVDEEVQQKQVLAEAAKKKKKKKVNMPTSAAEMQWRASQDFAAENYMMPPGPNPYNPYWNGMQPGMQPGMNPFMAPPYGGGMPPYMGGYGFGGPMDVPFGGMFPQDPFGVPSGLMMPPFIPPQRDLAELGRGMNGGGPPIMSREEFEARRAELKWKREHEKHGAGGTGSSREQQKERDFSLEGRTNDDGPPMKAKSRPIPPPISDGHRHRTDDHHHSREEHPDVPPHPSSKWKSSSDRYDYDDIDDSNHYRHSERPSKSHRRVESSSSTRRSSQAPPSSDSKAALAAITDSDSASDRKHKKSVFDRINFPEEAAAASKKHKVTSSSSEAVPASGSAVVPRKSSTKTAAVAVDFESSDDERHFKRRPPRYETSPVREHERVRDRDRERDRDLERDREREHYSKHR